MITVGIFIKDSVTLEYNRLELFSDEKISVNSSIQNVNDISKTFTDFSQTFTVPASKQNNKIFRHWYENSNDNGFSTLVKADAYIEIDTILFRSGKIQLESCSVKDGQPQDYSITFIGTLGSLKDKFNGLYLKDLTDTTYDFLYTPTLVKDKVTSQTTTPTYADIKFPLIASSRYWNYGKGGSNDISIITTPIYYNELFPAIRLKSVLNMIESRFGINLDGTTSEPSTFLTDGKFTSAYLYLKNSEVFIPKNYIYPIDLITLTGSSLGWTVNTSLNYFQLAYLNYTTQVYHARRIYINFQGTSGAAVSFYTYLNGGLINTTTITATGLLQSDILVYENLGYTFPLPSSTDKITFSISTNTSMVQSVQFKIMTTVYGSSGPVVNYQGFVSTTTPTLDGKTRINTEFPDIKIEDFFSGLLKMFNLTCYSTDGINYTIKQLEDYYKSGTIRDITKYIKSDGTNLNRVKTYKKINFEYEKSESLVNVGFMSANGIEYGSLFYDTENDGDEYNIKLPFEDLNFNNLKDKLQVGYNLKNDGITKYIPKPIILYEYDTSAITTVSQFYLSTSTSGSGSGYTSYKAFGQEYYDGTNTYGLNFNQQQSTLTNEVIDKGLYDQYYKNYLSNIFDSKARLIKVSGILPTSLLTTLKLNDRLIIRDKRYLINTFTTDLTTGEVQFELLTDFRTL